MVYFISYFQLLEFFSFIKIFLEYLADGLVMQPALFVSPSCVIRFQPVSSDTFWSADEARVNTKLKIKIWNVRKLEILPRKFDSLIEKFKETGVIVVDLCADEVRVR